MSHDHISAAVLAVLHLCLLRYFSTNLADRADNCYASLYFSFLFFFNLEFKNLFISVPSVLSYVFFCSLSFLSYSFLLFFLFPVVSLVDDISVNVKFTPFLSRAHVVKSHFNPLRISVLKAPTSIFFCVSEN